MIVRRRSIRCRPTSRETLAWLLAFVGFALIAGPTAASGSEITAGSHASHAATDDDSGGHRCKCKSCRGESSCCCAAPKRRTQAHAASRPAAEAPRSTADRVDVAPDVDSGPCVGAAPCGEGSGLPPSAPGLTINKAFSTLHPHLGLPPVSIGRCLATVDSLCSAVLAARLDDPPEGSLVAIA